MIKILEYAEHPHLPRQEFLKKEFGAEFVSLPTEGFSKAWLKTQTDLAVVLLATEKSDEILSMFQALPADIQVLRACDMLENQQDKWWPRSLLKDVLNDFIIERCPQLDTHFGGYVTGSGAATKIAVGVLFQLGYKKINMTATNMDELSDLIEQLKQKHFGVTFQIIKNDELTLQPNNGSILINTIPFSSKELLLQDLFYLNFIRPSGLVVDFSVFPLQNDLIQEAAQVGIKSLTGAEVQGVYDWTLFSKILGPAAGTRENYMKKWISFLEEIAKTLPVEAKSQDSV